MTMSTMDTLTHAPIPAKKRFGLIAAKIGVDMVHKLSVELPMMAPRYSTNTQADGLLARTRIAKANPAYKYDRNERGETYAASALPGANIYLVVQDISRLEPELVQHVKWMCRHPDCAGQRHATREDLIRSHGDNRDLIAEAERSIVGQAHIYVGVLELTGKRNDKRTDKDGKVMGPEWLQEPTVMLLSNEE